MKLAEMRERQGDVCIWGKGTLLLGGIVSSGWRRGGGGHGSPNATRAQRASLLSRYPDVLARRCLS